MQYPKTSPGCRGKLPEVTLDLLGAGAEGNLGHARDFSDLGLRLAFFSALRGHVERSGR